FLSSFCSLVLHRRSTVKPRCHFETSHSNDRKGCLQLRKLSNGESLGLDTTRTFPKRRSKLSMRFQGEGMGSFRIQGLGTAAIGCPPLRSVVTRASRRTGR